MLRNKETLEDLLINKSLNYEKVGRIFGVTGAAIKKQALKLGINLPSKRRVSKEYIPHNKKEPKF